MHQRQLRVVGAFAVELGVERVPRLSEQGLDQIIEIALTVDPAVLEAWVSHRWHRARHR